MIWVGMYSKNNICSKWYILPRPCTDCVIFIVMEFSFDNHGSLMCQIVWWIFTPICPSLLAPPGYKYNTFSSSPFLVRGYSQYKILNSNEENFYNPILNPFWPSKSNFKPEFQTRTSNPNFKPEPRRNLDRYMMCVVTA